MTKGLLKVIKKAVQYATIVRIIRRAVPMFHRIAGRGVRPVWKNVNQMSKRNIWSKRDIPIRTSRAWEDGGYCARRQAPWVARELENWRKLMERFMQPRTFDAYYVRPRNQRYAEETVRSEVERVKYDHNGFEVSLDVQNFVPAELEVKVTGNRLVVSGKHEQRADQHGFVAREFHREFEIPEDVDLETLNSSISDEGFLTIQAKIKGAETPAEKRIEIKFEKAK